MMMSWEQEHKPAGCCDALNICKSIGRSARFGRSNMGSDSDESVALNVPTSRSSTGRWTLFWRRVKRGKRKIFNSPIPEHVPYDSYTYTQNFDQGSSWAEPDNLSRSFSARYAGRSGIFQRNGTTGFLMSSWDK